MNGQVETQRISLWSGPRNISTALMYAFAQRSDTRVYDEPLYGHYLAHNPARSYHPGAEVVLHSMQTDGLKVIEMMLQADDHPVHFFKNMAHHLHGLPWDFMLRMRNVLLTRDPVEMLPSYAAVIEAPSLEDVGYKMHLEIVDYLKDKGKEFIVLDAKKVLLNPEDQIKKLCAALNLSFSPSMLSWEPGARPEDGSWAPYWYASVHRSSGFAPYKTKESPFPERLMALLEECRPYYERLAAMAL